MLYFWKKKFGIKRNFFDKLNLLESGATATYFPLCHAETCASYLLLFRRVFWRLLSTRKDVDGKRQLQHSLLQENTALLAIGYVHCVQLN